MIITIASILYLSHQQLAREVFQKVIVYHRVKILDFIVIICNHTYII